MPSERIWLDVPYTEKDAAKAVGARWDPQARRWYAPRPGMGGLQRWAARPEMPEVLPGEDRSFGQGLFVDLVPSSCWFTNVRSCVDQRDWERLRRMITSRAGQRCEACGRPADRDLERWLEAHERWEYLEAERIQRLKRLICLCTDCHRVTHFGLARLRGQGEWATAHLMSVTGMTGERARAHVDRAFALWQRRSAHTWRLDLSMLTDAGITLTPPPEAERRVEVAEQKVSEDPIRAAYGHQPSDSWDLDCDLDDVTPGVTSREVVGPPTRASEPTGRARRRWWPFSRRTRR